MTVGFLKKWEDKQNGFLILFLVIAIAPLLYISFYNQPSTDDYGCTTVVQAKGFFQAQSYFYHNWSGRYFATALASLNPLVFHSYIGYKILSFFLVILFVFSIYWLCSLIFKAMNPLFKWGVTSLFVFIYFLHLPELAEGLFWMSGSLTYQTAITFSVLFLGCIIKYLQSGKSIYFLFSIFLSFAAIGSNEVSMLYTSIMALLIFSGNYWLNKKINYYLFAVLAASIAFSVFVITAPGNHIRGSYFPMQHQFLKSLQNTYNFGAPYLHQWAWENLIFFLFTFSVFFTYVDSNTIKKLWVMPNPLVVLFFCICIPFIGIFPGYWSMGVTPPSRMMNVPYFYFLLGCIYFLYVLANYMRGKFRFRNDQVLSGTRLVLMGLVFLLAVIKPNNLKVVYGDIFSGRAVSYNNQMELRREFVNKFNGGICGIKAITDVPKALYFQDITADTSDWKNHLFDTYYGKNCVLVK